MLKGCGVFSIRYLWYLLRTRLVALHYGSLLHLRCIALLHGHLRCFVAHSVAGASCVRDVA